MCANTYESSRSNYRLRALNCVPLNPAPIGSSKRVRYDLTYMSTILEYNYYFGRGSLEIHYARSNDDLFIPKLSCDFSPFLGFYSA